MPSAETVIVTGSSGFIGSALVNKLAGRFTLVGFDRAAARQPAAAEFIPFDLTSDEAIARAEHIRRAHRLGGALGCIL